VILFKDPYTEYHEPHIGIAAAIARLYPAAARGEPILGLEPSEVLTFRDEAPDLVSAHLRDQARVVASRARLFEELVAQEAQQLGTLGFDAKPRRLLVHGRCHAKALCGMRPLLDTLAILPEARTEAIPSGCRGMAGAFGYESEHYDLSMRIGRAGLVPRHPARGPGHPGRGERHQLPASDPGRGRAARPAPGRGVADGVAGLMPPILTQHLSEGVDSTIARPCAPSCSGS